MNNKNATPHKVGRIAPASQVTEFDVCDFCFPTDIVQGSDGILYFTKNDASLGRITTEGTVLADIPAAFSANGNGLDAHGDDIWFADFNNHSVWRYDIPKNSVSWRSSQDKPFHEGGEYWMRWEIHASTLAQPGRKRFVLIVPPEARC